MPSRSSAYRLSFLGALLLTSSLIFASIPPRPVNYVGQWVLKLGNRNFIVINLREDHGVVTGTLSRPLHSSLGSSFSNISSATITENVISSIVEHDHLHFTVQKPTDRTHADTYNFTLAPPNQATLQMDRATVDPLTLTHVSSSPLLAVASDWDPHRAYSTEDSDQPSAVMQKIFEEDQKPRLNPKLTKEERINISKQDDARRAEVRQLLANGDLHTGKDFELAAFVFQHGNSPDDYLLAHTLAMIAVARGDARALWIATATLDRYLNSIQKPQIYGTQFHFIKGTPWTQDPYNRDLISDALRRDLGVPSLADQQKQLEEYKKANQP